MPSLRIELSPLFEGGALRHIDVSAVVSGAPGGVDGALLTYYETAASIPFCPLEGEVTARDAKGGLPLVGRSVTTPIPHVRKHDYAPARPPEGDVAYRYRVLPRTLPRDYNGGPYFDLRAEGGGASGAGLTFLVLPAGDARYDYAIHWDLSRAPEGSRAVSSYGEGDISGCETAEGLAFCYYAFGRLSRAEDPAHPGFTLLWLSEANFDMPALGRDIGALYHAMCAFFGDPGKPYRVIARQDPFFNEGGGTALPQSFMFGYSLSAGATARSLGNLIAHEMVHNWPRLKDEGEETTWYSEGTAEFYSALLPYRAGVRTAAEACGDLNEKVSRNYYRNPFQRLSNDEAAKLYWEDRRMQRVPYGRGLVYLTRVDAWIREHSGGKRSLDDVVVALVRREAAGEGTAVADFLALVSQCGGGADATADYEAMKGGAFMPLLPGSFGGLFGVEEYEAHYFELGFDYAKSFTGERRAVTGLVPGSQAEKAGIREGDEIAEFFRQGQMDRHEGGPFTVKLLRGGQVVPVEYIPEGKAVRGYRFVLKE